MNPRHAPRLTDLLGLALQVRGRHAAKAQAKPAAKVGDGSPSGPDPVLCDQILAELADVEYGIGYFQNVLAALQTLRQELRDEFAAEGCVV